MIEVIRHLVGACGEHGHPTIWNVLMYSPLLAPFLLYFNIVKYRTIEIFSTINKKLTEWKTVKKS